MDTQRGAWQQIKEGGGRSDHVWTCLSVTHREVATSCDLNRSETFLRRYKRFYRRSAPAEGEPRHFSHRLLNSRVT